jgi:hypothetical protein
VARAPASLAGAAVLAVVAAGACTHVVEIDSIPPGATVRVDGTGIGTAPARYEEVTGWRKSVIVEVELAGHATVRQKIEQTEWNIPITATSVCCSLGLGSPLSGLGVLPLTGLFFARQMPDRVVIALPPRPEPVEGQPPPIAY